MDKHAQVGLDYLLSYGWTVILIASLVGVVFFLLSPSTIEFECRVNNQRNLLFENISGFSYGGGPEQAEFWGGGKIEMQNISGGKITVTELKKDGYFYGKPSISGVSCTAVNSPSPVILGDKRKFEIEGLEIAYNRNLSVPAAECDLYPQESLFDKKEGNIYVSFTDEEGLPHQLIVSCSGFPPTE